MGEVGRPAELSGGDGAATAAPPVVGIAIPCYNHAHYLEECLRSLVAQTYEHWEALVIDDCSPDADQIQPVLDAVGDPRIRVVRHERNRGLAASRNTGFRDSGRDVLLAIDADDKFAPRCLELLVTALLADPDLDCVYPDFQLFGRRNDVQVFSGPPPEHGRVLHTDHTIPGAGTMMRRGLWERLGGYDEDDELRRGREDFEFWIRAFAKGCRAKRVPEPLYHYRISHSSMTFACRLEDHLIGDYIDKKNRALFADSREADRLLSMFYHRAAYSNYEDHERGKALRLAWRAWRLHPGLKQRRTLAKALVPLSLHRAYRRGEVRRWVPFLGYPLHSARRHRPFFVIGVARSGNTLFRRILTSHSGLHIPPETFAMGQCIRKWQRYSSKLAWPDLVHLTLAEYELHPEFHTMETWLGPLADRLTNCDPSLRNLAHVLNSIYQFHAEEHGVRFERWGDKTPFYSLDDTMVENDKPRRLGHGTPQTLERIRRVFPDAQFLHIYRDGCDVAYSFLRGNFVSRPTEAAWRWTHTVGQTLNFVRKYPQACHELRYEDLVADSETTIRGVCEFLGVEFEPAMLHSEGTAAKLGDVPEWSWHRQVTKPINARNPGKGRAYFSEHQKRALQEIMGAQLEALGYRPCTDTP